MRTPPTSTATVGWARKALVQRADVGGGAADVDDDRLGDAGEEGCAANRIGRPAGEGKHGKPLGVGGVHQRPVVLGEIKLAPDAARVERGAKRVDDELGEIAQARVHDCRVLALEQAYAADVARQRDVHAGERSGKDFARFVFASCVDRTEHRGDRDRADSLGADVRGDAAQFGFVERRNLAAVEFMAAVSEISVTADRGSEVVRPVDHRRQRGGRRQAEANRGGRREVAPLHDCVGEVGGADHDDVDRLRLHTRRRERRLERGDDPRHHVRRRRGLDAGENLRAVHDDSIGVGSADINANPYHPALPTFAVRQFVRSRVEIPGASR